MCEAHCKELGLNPETGEPGRATRVPRGGRDGIRGSKQKWRATEMDYGYLGEVEPGAIVAFLVPLAFIAGLLTVVTIRSRYSNRAGWLPREVHRSPQDRATRHAVRTCGA